MLAANEFFAGKIDTGAVKERFKIGKPADMMEKYNNSGEININK